MWHPNVEISFRWSFWRNSMFAAESFTIIQLQCWNTCFEVWMCFFPLLQSYPNFPFRTPSYQTSGSRKSQNLDIFVHPFPSISPYFHPFHSMSYCFHFPSMSSYFHFQSISSYFHPFLMHFHPVWPICRSNIPIFLSYFPIFSAPGHTFQDFHGGEFVFEAHGTSSAAAVEPRAGRVVAFSSDAENPHKVGAGFEPWGGVSSQKKYRKMWEDSGIRGKKYCIWENWGSVGKFHHKTKFK